MNKFVICSIFATLLIQVYSQVRIVFPDEIITGNLETRVTEIPEVTVTSPKFQDNWMCGVVNQFPLHHSGFIDNPDGGSDLHSVYYLNTTSEELESQGFDITVNDVGLGDVLCNFTYSNSTFKGTMAYSFIGSVLPTGGKPAPITRSYYMAQIGEKNGDEIKWLCDGALINHRWILTAAHCFVVAGVNPNIVRLGDHNLTDPRDPHRTSGLKFIRDYPLQDVIFHPEFKFEERYHDLALIQIPTRIPRRAPNFFPICLPWDEETNKNIVEKNVTLTGWGAMRYRGPKTPILQEVNLTVYDSLFCDLAYATIPDSQKKYPQGITEDKVLCVGWHEDGKDACGGDSGAPVVYLKDDYDLSKIKQVDYPNEKSCGGKTGGGALLDKQDKRYVLAGIVSGGYGCGLKDFPGLYIPINKPQYLQWIKDVAFKDYV